MAQPTCLEVETATGHYTFRCASSDRTRPLTDLLRQHDLPLNTRCGERGLCDGCLVELLEGRLVHRTTGQTVQVVGEPVQVHGCEYRLGDEQATIRVPARSLLAYDPEVLTDFRLNIPRALDPLWQVHPFATTELPSPDEREQWLQRQLANRGIGQRAVQIVPQAHQAIQAIDGATMCYATVEFRPDTSLVTSVLPGRPKAAWGVAVDVGTTTVVVLIVDLSTGQIVGRAAGFNHQMTAGDNVLTRINLCLTDPASLEELQELLVQHTIARLVETALRQTEATTDAVVCYVMSGNTTMLHLLAGVDPSPMGMAPFTPRFLEHRVLSAAAIRLVGNGRSSTIAREAPSTRVPARSTAVSAECQQTQAGDPAVHLLPGAAAYVGADLCAGVLSSGLRYDEGPSLLVDAGTNGEIILKSGDALLGCATAAGPAFEGAGLTCGMRAGSGAISHLQMKRQPFQVSIDVIGKDGQKTTDQKPQGICGSGYIDFLAEARRIGLLTPSGRIDEGRVPDASEHVIRDEEKGLALVVGLGPGRRKIIVTETDIASLLQAKAAIAAGILTLLEKTHLTAAAVKTLYLAGGFGMQLDVANAIASGLLPGFTPEQVQLVGNTSLAGAYLALLDGSVVEELSRIAKQLDVIELNLDPAFESRFIDQLALP